MLTLTLLAVGVYPSVNSSIEIERDTPIYPGTRNRKRTCVVLASDRHTYYTSLSELFHRKCVPLFTALSDRLRISEHVNLFHNVSCLENVIFDIGHLQKILFMVDIAFLSLHPILRQIVVSFFRGVDSKQTHVLIVILNVISINLIKQKSVIQYFIGLRYPYVYMVLPFSSLTINIWNQPFLNIFTGGSSTGAPAQIWSFLKLWNMSKAQNYII